MREWLLDGFRYDLWANRQWAPLAVGSLVEVARPDSPDETATEPRARLESTFGHLLWAQRIWLERLGVRVFAEGEAWLVLLNEGWMDAVRQRDPSEILDYRNTKGAAFSRPFGDVAWHVLNHGTYHRGQMREIAENGGLDWPETDLTGWRTQTA